MEGYKPWALIKIGFWLGIGFAVPTLVVDAAGTGVALAVPDMMQEKMASSFDKTEHVRVSDMREVRDGDRLAIFGVIENTGTSRLGSVMLEAELLDSAKRMVLECSELVRRRLDPGAKENFQISCGCGSRPIPAYESMTVRAVSASAF